MSFLQTKTEAQLRKWNKLLLGVAIGILVLMIIVIGMSLFQISEGEESNWLSLSVPIILGPVIIIPLLFSSAISQKLKKRKNTNL
ncbi:MAG: cytochrome bd-type quinol oxidase subunit 2 [Maribacter sp.]|jgi:cytochrome bd-type quinol oxidase subunit 2